MKLNLSGKRSTKQQAKKGAKQTPLLTSPQSAMSTTDPTNFITEDKLTKKSRRIFLNIDAKDHKNRPLNQTFCTNRISTTKYTFYTFIPKNVYEQFRYIELISSI